MEEVLKTKRAALIIDKHLLNPPRGTRIFFGQDLQKRKLVEETLRKELENEGYEEILTPTLEHEEVFTAIRRAVNEKLYTLQDRSGRKLVLRPEMNAPVCRTVGLQIYKNSFPRKLYYFVPVFRYERSQRGTFREFWQLGIEYFGADQPLGEAAVIHTLVKCLDVLKIKDYFFKISNLSLIYELLINMGVKDLDLENVAYKVRFAKSEKQVEKDLTDYGVYKEVLARLLDLRSKVLNIQDAKSLLKNLMKDMPSLENRVNKTVSFFEVFEGLGLANKVQVDFKLMRGTNHYNDAVFQVHHPSLHGDICGGGRYDKMVGIYSENKLNMPAVGAAFGFDRIVPLSIVNARVQNKKALIVALEPDIHYLYKINSLFTSNNIVPMIFPKYSEIRKALDYARKNDFSYIVFVGNKELKEKTISILTPDSKQSVSVAMRDFQKFIDERLHH